MTKAYKLMRLLNSAQAADWLRELTGTPVAHDQLLELWKEQHCKMYVDCEGLDGTHAFSGKPVAPRGAGEIYAELYGKLSFTVSDGKLFTSGANHVSCPIWVTPDPSPQCGSVPFRDYDPCLLNFTEPREILFKADEIKAIADKMNGTSEQHVAAELESLRQQLELERARLKAAEMHALRAEAEAAKAKAEAENWRAISARNQELRESAQAESDNLRQQLESLKEEPSFPLAFAAVVELLQAPIMQPRIKGINQEAIKLKILEKFPWRGLGKRNLDKIFAISNKAKERIEPA